LKRAVAISIAVMVFTLGNFKAFVWLYYFNNQQSITLNYCVNKAKPEMHCNGKCYVEKQLSKTKDSQNTALSYLHQIKQVKDILWFCATPVSLLLQEQKSFSIQSPYFYQVMGLQTVQALIFHPPPEV
jgi:hypothetical protein